MTSYPTPAVSSDYPAALGRGAELLADEFHGTFNRETVERFLHSSYDVLAAQATVRTFLPVTAEKFARQRLRALAHVEGLQPVGKPTVLFLCVHNAGRSQMALGFFSHHAGDAAVAWSGGSHPGAGVSRTAITVMAERGIDSHTSSRSRGPTRSCEPPTR